MRPFNSLFLPLAAAQPVFMRHRGHQVDKHVIDGVSLDIENYCTIRAFPACQRRCLRFLVCTSVKIKGRDCGTINGHDESLSILALMKDAREAFVR